jgi:hypothetical protein
MVLSCAIRNGVFDTTISGWINLSPGGYQSMASGGFTATTRSSIGSPSLAMWPTASA